MTSHSALKYCLKQRCKDIQGFTRGQKCTFKIFLVSEKTKQNSKQEDSFVGKTCHFSLFCWCSRTILLFDNKQEPYWLLAILLRIKVKRK